MMPRFRRLRRWWPVLPIVLAALFLYAAWPGRSTFTVSPETTYVTDPVDAHGFVDYPAALNDRMAQGITPENNANVLIWKALGPHPEGGTMPAEYFRRLGIEQPPEQGDYLIDWTKYFKANLSTPPNDVLGLFNEELDWAKHWNDRVDRARRWPWKASDQPAIADWLKQNKKPLAIAIEASKRSEYFNPLVPKVQDPRQPRLIGSLLPNVQKCRAIVDELKIRAMGKVADGDLDGAWQDLMACQRLGRLIMRGRGTLIEHLVGLALVATATEAQVTFLDRSKASSRQLLEWLSGLQGLPAIARLTCQFDVGERFVFLDSLQGIATGGIEQMERLDDRPGTSQVSNPFWSRLFTHDIDWDRRFGMQTACSTTCRPRRG